MLKRIYESNNKTYFKNVIWNFVASGINGVESILILAIASRYTTLEKVGVLTISFTVANLLMNIGKFGVRGYQVTDISQEFSFIDYVKSRIITIFFMFWVLVLYAIYAMFILGYNVYKIRIVIFVTLIYSTEVIEDVILSEFQRRGKLFIGSIMFSIRWGITLFVWGTSIIIYKDIFRATTVAMIFAYIVLVMFLFSIKKSNIFSVDKKKKGGVLVLKKCYSLCIIAFLSIYLPNIVKYSIDRCLSDKDQALYGFITMPIFFVDLVAMIIFQPIISDMSMRLYEKEYISFYRKYYNMIGVVGAVSVIGIIIGSAIGVRCLSLLYSVDLMSYKNDFVVVMIGSAGLAYIGLFAAILTMLRKQKIVMYLYLVVSLIVTSISDKIVANGITEGIILNTGVLTLVAIILAVICQIELKARYSQNIAKE